MTEPVTKKQRREGENDAVPGTRPHRDGKKNAAASIGTEQIWLTWTLCDSALSTGGFAHSQGLESAVHKGFVKTSNDLVVFVRRLLDTTLHTLVPLVAAAAEIGGELSAWARLDRLAHAAMSNHVSRKCSEATGSALLRVAVSTFPEAAGVLGAAKRALRGDATLHGHHAPLFGLLCGELGLDAATASRMYLFMCLRDALSAATRLNLVGPLEASRLQRGLVADAESLLARDHSPAHIPALPVACASLDAPSAENVTGVPSSTEGAPSEEAVQVAIWQTDPLLDLIQGCHDHLYSRLFVS